MPFTLFAEVAGKQAGKDTARVVDTTFPVRPAKTAPAPQDSSAGSVRKAAHDLAPSNGHRTGLDPRLHAFVQKSLVCFERALDGLSAEDRREIEALAASDRNAVQAAVPEGRSDRVLGYCGLPAQLQNDM